MKRYVLAADAKTPIERAFCIRVTTRPPENAEWRTIGAGATLFEHLDAAEREKKRLAGMDIDVHLRVLELTEVAP